MLAVALSLACFFIPGLTVEPVSAPAAKWVQKDLKDFGDFFFEADEEGAMRPREIGRLPEERTGALRKLSLNSQLKDYLQEKDDNSWRMALARLLAFDSLVRLGFVGVLGLWDLRVRRLASMKVDSSGTSTSGQSMEGVKEGLSQQNCREKVTSVAEPRPSHSKRKLPATGSFFRLSVASGLAAWLAYDLYQASQYQGADLSLQWIQDRSMQVDSKKSLGDQLSSLQTSSLFEDLKAHLKQRGLNGTYLARVIAPFSEDDLWTGSAQRAFVIIDNEVDRSVPSVTVELKWIQDRGSWIYGDSWFGTPEKRLVGGQPF